MRTGLLACVIVHAVLAGLHGASHLHVPVPLTGRQQAFVASVIMVAPVAGACLSFTRYRVSGAALVCIAMAASFIFGVAYHFVIDSADHIARVPLGPGRPLFIGSAFAIAASEFIGALFGLLAWSRWRRTGGVSTAGITDS